MSVLKKTHQEAKQSFIKMFFPCFVDLLLEFPGINSEIFVK